MDFGAVPVNERALLFGKSHSVVGVMTCPPNEAPDGGRPALIILNAGLVHRVGPNRLHVTVARRMAEQGFVAVRFDFSGIGESLPRPDSMPYAQSAVLEVREVMDAVTELTGIRRFCLMGLSSGALVSLGTALTDQRVVGAAIVNPHGFADSAEWDAHVANLSEGGIYGRNVLRLESWRRLLTGKTNYRRLGETLWYKVAHRRKAARKVSSIVDGIKPTLTAFLGLNIRILLLFSGKDRSIVNFEEILGHGWRQELGRNVEMVMIPDANHTFAGPVYLQQAVASIDRWMAASWPGGQGDLECRDGRQPGRQIAGA